MTRRLAMDWEAFEQAFRNNARRVFSYLHVPTGEVVAVVRGTSSPEVLARIGSDPSYVLITPATPREQHVWLYEFTRSVKDDGLRMSLSGAILGMGAFARFKTVLAGHPDERARWLAFRYQRRRAAMEDWFERHGLTPLNPLPDYVACPNEAASPCSGICSCAKTNACRADLTDAPCRGERSANTLRHELDAVASALGPHEIDALADLAELILARRMARAG